MFLRSKSESTQKLKSGGLIVKKLISVAAPTVDGGGWPASYFFILSCSSSFSLSWFSASAIFLSLFSLSFSFLFFFPFFSLFFLSKVFHSRCTNGISLSPSPLLSPTRAEPSTKICISQGHKCTLMI